MKINWISARKIDFNQYLNKAMNFHSKCLVIDPLMKVEPTNNSNKKKRDVEMAAKNNS